MRLDKMQPWPPEWGPRVGFRGSPEALKWNRRDLPTVDRLIGMLPKERRRVAVQAGGHLGIFPKRLAEKFAHVYTFEPADDLFVALCQNAPARNIYRYQAALGDSHTFVGLSRKRRDAATKPGAIAHAGITHVSGSGPVPTLRIDDFGFDVCDLIMLDLEGWELYALRGAAQTIARCRPLLCVEVNKNLGFVGLSKDDVRDLLASWDYRQVGKEKSDEIYQPQEVAA